MEFREVKYKDVKQDMYCVSEYGDVYSKYLKRNMKLNKDKDGYLVVGLQTESGKKRLVRIATLVAEMFLEKPILNDETVDHIDGDKLNNHYSNLRWLERGTNSAIRRTKLKGEANTQHRLCEKEVLQICELLQDNSLSLVDISRMFNVDKSTISNIKRKKTWRYLTDSYNFKIKIQKNKEESERQRAEILSLLKKGFRHTDILQMGYPNSVICRVKRKWKDSKQVVNND